MPFEGGCRVYPTLGGLLPLLLSIVAQMLLRTSTSQAALGGVTMKEIAAQQSKDIVRFSEPELMLAPQNANMPHPRLIEFVRLLARHTAQEWYKEITAEHRQKRS